MELQPRIKTFEMGGETFTLETGRIARQATGAVLVSTGDTAVLGTVVGAKEPKPGQGFFPLTVNYQEKTYAAGKIPGGFFKREGRPSEKETLTSRLIDRPIRPLFPNGYMNEVQVVLTVMSASKNHDPDIAAMIAASAALAISGIPFDGPIGAARVGYTNEKGYFLNPTFEELSTSLLDMVVAGTDEAVLMVESEAKGLTEDQGPVEKMLNAFTERSKVISEGLQSIEGMTVAKPTGAFYAFPNVKKFGENCQNVADYLLKIDHLKLLSDHIRFSFISHPVGRYFLTIKFLKD